MKPIIAGLLIWILGSPAFAVPLLTIEQAEIEASKDTEAGQVIRIEGQGPLPYRVLQKGPDKLVLFLLRTERGLVSEVVSLPPLAEITLEANALGTQMSMTLQDPSVPYQLRSGKKTGTIEVFFPTPVAQPDPIKAAAPLAPTPAKAPTAGRASQPPGGVGASPLQDTVSAGTQGTTTPQAGDISVSAEEEPDPLPAGIAPVPSRPVAPPP